ncbi:MAG: PEP-utilizing enzyme, partial [Meiothermus sp.]|nr:PEP-utilizing enzyme [Meiothermus sp.]
MKVILRLPERKEVEIKGNRPLREVLLELGLNPETVVAVRGEELLTLDQVVGQRIGAGRVRVIGPPREMHKVGPGDVLVADMTDPDWEPVMKRAAAIVTNRGGRTCHAAIVARELGIPAV